MSYKDPMCKDCRYRPAFDDGVKRPICHDLAPSHHAAGGYLCIAEFVEALLARPGISLEVVDGVECFRGVRLKTAAERRHDRAPAGGAQ